MFVTLPSKKLCWLFCDLLIAQPDDRAIIKMKSIKGIEKCDLVKFKDTVCYNSTN